MKLLGAVFLCIALTGAALAAAMPDWNGTWIGNWDKGGNGTQIVFAGNTFISIFWDNDYVDATGALSEDGKIATITWPGAQATLTRDGAGTAHIVIHEKGKPEAAFPVKLDK
jgi:hypothetical protein